jgi:hypothetical protein
MRVTRLAAIALLCILVSACGGGGGGGGGPKQPQGTFSLSANSATFTALQGGPPPPSTSITMTITGTGVAGVGAAYIGGATQPLWLDIAIAGSGNTYRVIVSIRSTSLAPGQYSSTFSVGTGDANGNVLQSQQITVSYSIAPRLSLSGTAYSGSFIYGDTTTGASIPLTVTAPDRTWTATSNAPWLQVPAGNQSGTGTLNVTVNANALAPGNYQGELRVVNTANFQDTVTRDFSVTVTEPTFTVAQDSIKFGGDDGRVTTGAQPLSFSITSGAALHPYSITTNTANGGNWLNVSTSSGTVGVTTTNLQVTAARGTLTGATYTGEVRVQVTVRDLIFSKVIPVTYNIEASRLVVGSAGVAFSTSPAPARSVLSRTVAVYSSIGRTDVPWTATSDASWLTVTNGAGMTGASMTLTANPAGLQTDTTHFATVTVKSGDTLVENEQTIRVGFYANSAAVSDFSLTSSVRFIATSPVEPIVFANNGGADVTGYNIYTGAVARTFTGVAGGAARMVVSDDGRYLFVHDKTNLRVAQLDATTGAQVRIYSASLAGQAPYGGFAYFRPAGYSILVTPSSRMFDIVSNTEVSDPMFVGATFALDMRASADSNYLVNEGGGVFRMQRTALQGGKLTGEFLMSPGTAQGREGQACISADLTRVYTASGYPYDFRGTNILTRELAQILPADAYPNSILCLWNGAIVGGIDGYYEDTDIWVYNGITGQELTRLSSSANATGGYRRLLERGMSASGDATRLMTMSPATFEGTSATDLRFQSIPAPP